MKTSTFAERLAEAIAKRKIKQTDLSKITGINKSSICTYLKGEYKAKQDKMDLLARALNVSPVWLMGYDVPMEHTEAIQSLESVNQAPAYFDTENKYDVDFCITVCDDSMINAGINNGDIVFIKSMQDVPNGKIACIETDNEIICLKRFYRNKNHIILISENPAYPPMNLDESSAGNIKILGLAVLKQSEIH